MRLPWHAGTVVIVWTATDIAADKPSEDPNVRGDAFKTLIVCRLSYQATEEDLEREFGRIGNIERVRL